MMYELKRKIGDTVKVHIGDIISFEKLREIGDLKEITKFIKGLGIKRVQSQIQDDQLRVTGKSKDDLQEVMAKLKENDFKIAITFTNYR